MRYFSFSFQPFKECSPVWWTNCQTVPKTGLQSHLTLVLEICWIRYQKHWAKNKQPSEQRDHGHNSPLNWAATRQRRQCANNMPSVPVNAAFIAGAQTWAVHIELRAAVPKKKNTCCRKRCFFLHSARILINADLAFHNTGALAATEYGRLAMWVHLNHSGLGAAPKTARWCTTAGAPPRS